MINGTQAVLVFLVWFISAVSPRSPWKNNLYHFLKRLTRVFCNIGHCFQDTPFQTRRTEIFEVRPIPFLIFFDSQGDYSRQSFISIIVVCILERQVLRMHTTLKSLWWNFEQYSCYISAPMLTASKHCKHTVVTSHFFEIVWLFWNMISQMSNQSLKLIISPVLKSMTRNYKLHFAYELLRTHVTTTGPMTIHVTIRMLSINIMCVTM